MTGRPVQATGAGYLKPSSGWVTVEKRKLDRPGNSWQARELARDEFGLWLGALAGDRNTHTMSGVQLFPQGASWWVAWWWADPQGPWCAADVCTSPRSTGGTLVYADLEIDVVLARDGSVAVVDLDEFEEQRAAVPYPDDVTRQALAAATELEEHMRARSEPFGERGWSHLDRLLRRAGDGS